MKQYDSHRDKHGARGHLYRQEGFEELNKKYGTEYNAFDKMGDMDDDMNKNYNMYRERFYERYWDTKENHAYYSLPTSERAWLTFKKVSDFWTDFWILWLGCLPIFLLYNASQRSKKTRIVDSS